MYFISKLLAVIWYRVLTSINCAAGDRYRQEVSSLPSYSRQRVGALDADFPKTCGHHVVVRPEMRA